MLGPRQEYITLKQRSVQRPVYVVEIYIGVGGLPRNQK
jgi:hypothetical protein